MNDAPRTGATKAIMVERSDSGTYEISGAAELEDWHDVRTDADEIEDLGPLKGWGEYTRVYRVRVTISDWIGHYFVAE